MASRLSSISRFIYEIHLCNINDQEILCKYEDVHILCCHPRLLITCLNIQDCSLIIISGHAPLEKDDYKSWWNMFINSYKFQSVMIYTTIYVLSDIYVSCNLLCLTERKYNNCNIYDFIFLDMDVTSFGLEQDYMDWELLREMLASKMLEVD